jgi:hypothetical protein
MSFPPGTEMFQFPGFASTHYGFMCRYPKGVGCPIRIPTDQRLLAAPRGFSQRATSFIASWCQGIHRMPFSCSRHRRIQQDAPPCTETSLRNSCQLSVLSCQRQLRTKKLQPSRAVDFCPLLSISHTHTPLTARHPTAGAPRYERNNPGQTCSRTTPR